MISRAWKVNEKNGWPNQKSQKSNWEQHGVLKTEPEIEFINSGNMLLMDHSVRPQSHWHRYWVSKTELNLN